LVRNRMPGGVGGASERQFIYLSDHLPDNTGHMDKWRLSFVSMFETLLILVRFHKVSEYDQALYQKKQNRITRFILNDLK